MNRDPEIDFIKNTSLTVGSKALLILMKTLAIVLPKVAHGIKNGVQKSKTVSKAESKESLGENASPSKRKGLSELTAAAKVKSQNFAESIALSKTKTVEKNR